MFSLALPPTVRLHVPTAFPFGSIAIYALVSVSPRGGLLSRLTAGLPQVKLYAAKSRNEQKKTSCHMIYLHQEKVIIVFLFLLSQGTFANLFLKRAGSKAALEIKSKAATRMQFMLGIPDRIKEATS